MNQPNRHADIAYLIILSALSGVTYYIHYINEFPLSLNNLIAFGFLIIAILIKIARIKFHQFILLMLLLATFDVINFVIDPERNQQTEVFGFSAYHLPGFNPLLALLLILYVLINFNTVKTFILNLFNKRDPDKDMMIDFYHHKYFEYSTDELKDVFAAYDQYPVEAQIALKDIHQQKKLNIRKFE